MGYTIDVIAACCVLHNMNLPPAPQEDEEVVDIEEVEEEVAVLPYEQEFKQGRWLLGIILHDFFIIKPSLFQLQILLTQFFFPNVMLHVLKKPFCKYVIYSY